jgi:phage terminase large subunit-like protein
MAAHPSAQYALEVTQGKRVVGQAERQACERHLADLAVSQGDTNFPWVFDETRAERIFSWFRYCRHVEGPLAGRPIELQPFQLFDLGCMFGWVHRETRERRFQKAFITEARKNAKTTILAGVALYLMVGDQEESPDVYCAAVDRDQARIMYRAAMAMARKSPEMRGRLKIRDYELAHRTRGGQMVALSRDKQNKDGLKPHGAIIDEYHAHVTSEIYDLLWSAWGSRSQALMAIITTAGMDTESPCYKEYQYCKQILSGAVRNDRYFVMIREMDPDDDEHDPANWIKANPLRAGTPAGLARLKEQHDEAFDSHDPAKIRTFRVKNLNRWVHGTEDNFMGEFMDRWDGLALVPDEFWQLVKGMPAVVGVDLAKKIDLTADAFLFALPDGRVAISACGFMPEETLKRHEQTDRIPYREWAQAGWLQLTEGDVTDYHRVQTHIQDMQLEHDLSVHEVCYDPYNATHFATELADLGYTCIEIRQGVRTLSEPTKLFRELVATGKLVHDGSPLLKWCVGNAVQVTDTNENIKLSKETRGDTRRIDLLAAAIDALVRIQSLRDAVEAGNWINSPDFGF